jgi:hydrogenase maturation protein HypF
LSRDAAAPGAPAEARDALELRIRGRVQGVGFRPYLWQLAQRWGLCGEVCNDGAGVLLRLLEAPALSDFLRELPLHCPPLAMIERIDSRAFRWSGAPEDFRILHSGAGQMDTQIVADAATCEACLGELADPRDRRYRYPFINCTHCGPRFSLIRGMPYDRPNTSMRDFPLCADCLAEYQNPADRRFHAQPTACPACGPQLWASDAQGMRLAEREDALQLAARALLAGEIVAIKGLGGFHLACDATAVAAVERLRQRKRRPDKPLAVMLPDAHWLARCAQLDEPTAALDLLRSAAAPIVLLPLRRKGALCEAIAPGLDEVGVMLPANPIQHLLIGLVGRPLVMTSGNASGRPPALSNAQALAQLQGIADCWLLHDREILQRADDSLVRLRRRSASEMLRRGRGYVPEAIALPAGFDAAQASLLAMGADSKNAFCLLRNGSAVLGQHLGDLQDLDVQAQQRRTLELFRQVYAFTPQLLVVDAHPGYLSHRLGREIATRLGVPCVEVLHHHAHLAACLAENHWAKDAGEVVGLALDGLGYGADGRLWGGECLRLDYARATHAGGLPALPMPGGERAAREPWRNLLAQFERFVPGWRELPEARCIAPEEGEQLVRAMARGLNAPPASSTGRLFDAVAAALGITPRSISWEGQAACRLEALARQCTPHQAPVEMPLRGDELDLETFWRQWLDYRETPQRRAYAFHQALAKGFAALARRSAERDGLDTVALSGGALHNRLLRRLLVSELAGLRVLQHARLPAGDGGIALGQALVSLAAR